MSCRAEASNQALELLTCSEFVPSSGATKPGEMRLERFSKQRQQRRQRIFGREATGLKTLQYEFAEGRVSHFVLLGFALGPQRRSVHLESHRSDPFAFSVSVVLCVRCPKKVF